METPKLGTRKDKDVGISFNGKASFFINLYVSIFWSFQFGSIGKRRRFETGPCEKNGPGKCVMARNPAFLDGYDIVRRQVNDCHYRL